MSSFLFSNACLDPLQGVLDFTSDAKPFRTKVVQAEISVAFIDSFTTKFVDTLEIEIDQLFHMHRGICKQAPVPCVISDGFESEPFGDPNLLGDTPVVATLLYPTTLYGEQGVNGVALVNNDVVIVRVSETVYRVYTVTTTDWSLMHEFDTANLENVLLGLDALDAYHSEEYTPPDPLATPIPRAAPYPDPTDLAAYAELYGARVLIVHPVTPYGLQTVNSIMLHAGNTVMVTGQLDHLQNGIYSVSTGWWTRLDYGIEAAGFEPTIHYRTIDFPLQTSYGYSDSIDQTYHNLFELPPPWLDILHIPNSGAVVTLNTQPVTHIILAGQLRLIEVSPLGVETPIAVVPGDIVSISYPTINPTTVSNLVPLVLRPGYPTTYMIAGDWCPPPAQICDDGFEFKPYELIPLPAPDGCIDCLPSVDLDCMATCNDIFAGPCLSAANGVCTDNSPTTITTSFSEVMFIEDDLGMVLQITGSVGVEMVYAHATLTDLQLDKRQRVTTAQQQTILNG
jgi:hypothetical protein